MQVGRHERGDHRGQRHRDRLARRPPLRLGEEEPQHHDAYCRDEQPGADAQQHLARVPRLAGDGGVEDQHPQQRAERIDEHALPHEQ